MADIMKIIDGWGDEVTIDTTKRLELGNILYGAPYRDTVLEVVMDENDSSKNICILKSSNKICRIVKKCLANHIKTRHVGNPRSVNLGIFGG